MKMVTKADFGLAMAYIAEGCPGAKPLSRNGMEVYFDCLSDLPLAAIQVAAKRAVLEHKYATFPPVALLRSFATEAVAGVEMTAGEAWKLAWRAIGRIDLEVPGQLERETKNLPVLVLNAMECFGIPTLIAAEKVEVARAQFMRIYSDLAAREHQAKILPASLRAAIEKIGLQSSVSLSPVRKVAASIGVSA
jgi:hypothetical protein